MHRPSIPYYRLQDYLQDLIWLLHFVDNWELSENNFEWKNTFNFQSVIMTMMRMMPVLIMSSLDWSRMRMWSNDIGVWSLVVGSQLLNYVYATLTSFFCSNTREATALQAICPYIWWETCLGFTRLVSTFRRQKVCESVWSDAIGKDHHVICNWHMDDIMALITRNICMENKYQSNCMSAPIISRVHLDISW